MLEPKAPLHNHHVANLHVADTVAPKVESASPRMRRSRSHSRPTVLVVHSRCHAVRFRILSTHAPTMTDVPVSLFPVSFLQGHRKCQKAMDCDGDETSDRYQR